MRKANLAMLLFVLSLPLAAAAQETAYTNARIVDPATRRVTEGTIVVRDGRIVRIASSLTREFTGRRVDLGRRWVIPGLVDMHTHSFGNGSPVSVGEFLGPQGTARRALAAGVMAYLDLFSPEDMILGLRDQQRSAGASAQPMAWIFAAGPCLTATNGHCSEYGVPTRLVDSPADAQREIDALASKRPDVVKVVYDHRSYGGRTMPSIDRATLDAVVSNAKRHGLKTVVHVGSWSDLRDAVMAGAAAVTHTPGPEPPPADIARLMVERGTAHIPTLAVQSDFGRVVDNRSMLEDPLLIAVTPDSLRNAYATMPDTLSRFAGYLEFQRASAKRDGGVVRQLFEGGVTILAGTDAGNLGVFQGWSVHRELELLVAAGLPVWDALRSATTNAAAFLGKSWGVAPDNEATFVVLEASPLDDIRNTRRIHSVVYRGAVVDLAALRGPAGD